MTAASSIRSNHPCFSAGSRQSVGRLHLPVAPKANARVRFSDAPTAKQALTPQDALSYLKSILDSGTEVGVVGITGPGDPLALPEPTLETLRLVREAYPEMDLCLTTLGLGGAAHAQALADLGLSHVTVLVDAVDPAIAQMIYAWIRPGLKTLGLQEAASLLVDEQANAIAAFKEAGLTVKVNSTVYCGCNAEHVPDVAKVVADLGADLMHVVPYSCQEGCEYSAVEPGTELMAFIRTRVAELLPLMEGEADCGSELVGTQLPELVGAGISSPMALPKPTPGRPNVAVSSASGVDIDLHLGQTQKFLVYGPREDGLACLLGTRPAPAPGGGGSRWEELAMTLSDCFAVLTAGAGEAPREVLSGKGIKVLISEADVEGVVDVLFGGSKKKGKGRRG